MIAALKSGREAVTDFDVSQRADRAGQIKLGAVFAVILKGKTYFLHAVRQRLFRRLKHDASETGIGVEHARWPAHDFVGVDINVVAIGNILNRVIHVGIQGTRTAQADRLTPVELRSARVEEYIGGPGRPNIFNQVARHYSDRLRDFD